MCLDYPVCFSRIKIGPFYCEIAYVLTAIVSIVWCMKFKKALNKKKNTPIVRKDENGLKLKLIISSFNIRLLTLRKSVAL